MKALALVILGMALGFFPCAARAAEHFDIEAVTYADDAAAQAAWVPQFGSEPAALAPEKTPDGKPALAFRCDMAQLEQRGCWDRAVALNLSRFGRFAFWVKVEGDRTAVSHANLYFNAGGGWYGASFPLPASGWRQVVLDRGSFRPEDSPEGWNALKIIRISFWKGQPRRTTIYFGGMEAVAADVAIVRDPGSKDSVTFAGQVAGMLAGAGIDAGTVDNTDVEAGVLKGKKIAIYPCNGKLSDQEIEAVEAFVKEGGRLVVGYLLHPRLAALLGIEQAGWQRAEFDGQFSAMRFQPGAPAGMPAEAKQTSWNVTKVKPVGKGARVLAQWYDKDGKDTGVPAITLSDTGAFFAHVILRDDPENKQRLLRALLGHLCPAIWEEVAGKALARAGQLSRWTQFAEAAAGIAGTAQAAGRADAVKADLAAARAAYEKASALVQAKRYADALEPADEAHGKLLAAYARCQPAREGEFRAVWCHSAYGVAGMTWDEAIRKLKEAGFNAIVPNMLWGGVADYQSEVLPVRDRVARDGDQIALCVAAGKKYGVEVHPWKVNWNCGSGAPKEFLDRMRAEGRLQRTSAGKEQPWLCPSHPKNFELERDSMLEVVRKYDVDGIHFDYIRYPGPDNCFCDGCRARFEESAGVKVANWPKDVLRGGPDYEAYQEFRRGNITRLVKAVAEGARAIKPWVKISAAVFSNWPGCRDSVAQDWGHWVKQGYLDFVCPMDYTNDDDGYRVTVQVQRDEIAARIPFYPGVGASAPGLPLSQVIDQIQIGRSEGSDGFILFNYGGEVAHEYVPALGLGTTAGATLLPHNAPAVVWKVPAGVLKPGVPVPIEAAVTTRGTLREVVKSAEAAVTVTTVDGKPVKALGEGKSGGPAVKGEVTLPAGLYRVVARGKMTLASGKTQEFIARGPFLRVGNATN